MLIGFICCNPACNLVGRKVDKHYKYKKHYRCCITLIRVKSFF